MKLNNITYRIRELIYYKDDLILDHLYEEIFNDLDSIKEAIYYLKKYDKKHNSFNLKYLYIIEVL